MRQPAPQVSMSVSTPALTLVRSLPPTMPSLARSLIFLDEPTSGLDAFQAQAVMQSLWSLASNGRTVVSTIHQPRCAFAC